MIPNFISGLKYTVFTNSEKSNFKTCMFFSLSYMLDSSIQESCWKTSDFGTSKLRKTKLNSKLLFKRNVFKLAFLWSSYHRYKWQSIVHWHPPTWHKRILQSIQTSIRLLTPIFWLFSFASESAFSKKRFSDKCRTRGFKPL